MKYRMLALILALTVVSWAQTETAPSTTQQSAVPAEKAKCACCDKMAAGDMKDMKSCCAHHNMQSKDAKDTKEMASCCGGKDAKSCKKDGKDKTAAACCKRECKDSCGKDKTATACCGSKCGTDAKGCCSKTEKVSKNCCEKESRG